MIADPVKIKWQGPNTDHKQIFTLSKPLLIGRRRNCAITLPDDNISRIHVQVMADAQNLFITNVSDGNHVQIWEKEWQQLLAKGERVAFTNQIHFQIGGYRFRVRRMPRHSVVQCSNCGNLIDAEKRTCPICGRDLANARTRLSKD